MPSSRSGSESRSASPARKEEGDEKKEEDQKEGSKSGSESGCGPHHNLLGRQKGAGGCVLLALCPSCLCLPTKQGGNWEGILGELGFSGGAGGQQPHLGRKEGTRGGVRSGITAGDPMRALASPAQVCGRRPLPRVLPPSEERPGGAARSPLYRVAFTAAGPCRCESDPAPLDRPSLVLLSISRRRRSSGKRSGSSSPSGSPKRVRGRRGSMRLYAARDALFFSA